MGNLTRLWPNLGNSTEFILNRVILRSHILKLIVEEEINEIPEKYIINRWRKKDRKMNLPIPEIAP